MRDLFNALSLPELFDRLVVQDRSVKAALAEDLGEQGDITARSLIDAHAQGEGVIRSRSNGILAGAALLPRIAAAVDVALHVKLKENDGTSVAAGATIATVAGPLRSLLAAERIMLNYLGRLSGVATLTATYVEAIKDTGAAIYDTRKTTPGLRHLEKYAVRCGGGRCHRLGLHDAMLVKDNHLAGLPDDRWTQLLREAIARAKARFNPSFIEIEVDTLDQLAEVLPMGVDVILLDNMSPDQLKQAVAMRHDLAPQVALEASGGITQQTVRAVAETGVERIAVGALTHSAVQLDFGLDLP